MIKNLNSPKDTQKFASELAKDIKRNSYPHAKAFVLALVGDLGAGKTTFVKAFLRALKVGRKIASPTFLMIKRYPSPWPKYKNIYHVDCYRIKTPDELLDLGFGKIVDDPQNLVLVEWADKMKKYLPEDSFWINLKHGEEENERTVDIRMRGEQY